MRNYTLEVSSGYDHAKGGCGARRRLYDGVEARKSNAIIGGRSLRTWVALENPKAYYRAWTGTTSEIGEEMTSNPIVKKFTFTGSTGISKVLMAQCATTVKRTSMGWSFRLARSFVAICKTDSHF